MFFPTNWSEILKDPLTKKLSLWGFQLGGLALLIFAPDNILDASPVLAAIANFMTGIVPSIDKWVAHSPWPQPTRLFFAYCWITIPFQIVIIAKHRQSEERFVHGWRNSPKSKYFKPILLILIFGGLFLVNFYFALPYTESASSFDINPYKSKFVQAMYGVLMAFVNAMSLVSIVWWIKNFRFIYFNKSTQGGMR